MLGAAIWLDLSYVRARSRTTSNWHDPALREEVRARSFLVALCDQAFPFLMCGHGRVEPHAVTSFYSRALSESKTKVNGTVGMSVLLISRFRRIRVVKLPTSGTFIVARVRVKLLSCCGNIFAAWWPPQAGVLAEVLVGLTREGRPSIVGVSRTFVPASTVQGHYSESHVKAKCA